MQRPSTKCYVNQDNIELFCYFADKRTNNPTKHWKNAYSSQEPSLFHDANEIKTFFVWPSCDSD